MQPTRIVALLRTVLIAAWLTGCYQSSSVSSPPGAFVKIVSVSPGIATALKVGDKVKVQVEVNYNLPSDGGGIVSLVVQAANNASLANNMEVVKQGSGKAIISAEFVVPDSAPEP